MPDGTVVGDVLNAEFTEVLLTFSRLISIAKPLVYILCVLFSIQKMCTKIGWKGKGTEFDILPLVVSANGHDPDYFDYPPDLVLEVPLSHPT